MKKNWLPFILGLIFTVIVLTIAFVLLIFIPNKEIKNEVAALVTIIPASTSTPIVGLTIVPTPTIIVTKPVQGVYKFNIGEFVQITGTSGEGLRLRSEPGRSFSVNFIGLDAEVFEVVKGPIEADGYIWWYLEAPYDKNRNGWSVDDYLQKVTVP